jgi:hypothetical protein
VLHYILTHLTESSRSPPPSPSKSRNMRVREVSSIRQITAQPPSASPPPIRPIFQHIRALHGIMSSIETRPAIPVEDERIPSLGPAANEYLSAHGYNISSLHHIDHAHSTSRSLEDFIGYLHPRGMPWREVNYLWGLIQRDEAEA